MTRLNTLAATLAFGGVLALAPIAHALSPSSDTPTAQAQAPRPMMSGQARGAGMSDTQMMAMHQKMMADMAVMDANLDALVAKMNAAKGAARVDAIAEALTALVQQHKTMRSGMMQMQGQMMMRMQGSMAMPMGGSAR
jgi:hypothetical protein